MCIITSKVNSCIFIISFHIYLLPALGLFTPVACFGPVYVSMSELGRVAGSWQATIALLCGSGHGRSDNGTGTTGSVTMISEHN